jgi:hypothetical protein
VKLAAFSKFNDTTAAVDAASAICDGKLDKGLKKFLKKSLGKHHHLDRCDFGLVL